MTSMSVSLVVASTIVRIEPHINLREKRLHEKSGAARRGVELYSWIQAVERWYMKIPDLKQQRPDEGKQKDKKRQAGHADV